MSLRATKIEVGMKVEIRIPSLKKKLVAVCKHIPQSHFTNLNELPENDPFVFEKELNGKVHTIKLYSIKAGNASRLKVRIATSPTSSKLHFVTLNATN